MKESDIAHETPCGRFWVGRTCKPASYTVYKHVGAASYPDSSYALTADGLALAVYRAGYLAKRAVAQ